MLDPTPLKPGESYASVADIRDCVDLPEMPMMPGERMADGSFQPYWTRPDGSGLVVLVRAPSLAERRAIEQAVPDEKDSLGFVLETCLHCLKEPKLSREQLKDVLSTKHPSALIQISDQAWQLAELPASVITREVRRIAGLADEPPPRRAARPAPRTRPKRTPAPASEG
jgi:hypothetical protein